VAQGAGPEFKPQYHKNKTKTCLAVFTKLRIHPPYDLAIPVPGIYPRESGTDIQKTDIQMFTAVLCIIVKNWKQHRCTSTGKWVKKYN
jgi:hypothetical protein